MSNMLDIVGSVILFGILVLTIGRVQTNLNSAIYENTFTLVAQRSAVELAKQLEFDFTKIGHRTVEKIKEADSTRIKFKSDLLNNGSVDEIEYRVGNTSEATATPNPYDFPIKRKDKNGEIIQLWGTTKFLLTYYNSDYTKFPTPVVSDSLPKIYAINVMFTIEGRETVGGVGMSADTTHYAVTWQKLIYPRNMGY